MTAHILCLHFHFRLSNFAVKDKFSDTSLLASKSVSTQFLHKEETAQQNSSNKHTAP
jgi:hypothetical protein